MNHIKNRNATIQDADSVAAGIKTISLRILGTDDAKEQLESMDEELDDYVEKTASKKAEIIKNYTAVASNNGEGFSILDDNGNYKNTYDILLGISKIYKEIQEEDKKYGTNRATGLIEELAGKNRSNIASAILSSPDLLEQVKDSSVNADGSAEKELNSYLDSIEGKLEKFQNEVQRFWYDFISSDSVKSVVDFGTEVIKVLDKIVGKVGILKTAIAGLVGFANYKLFNNISKASGSGGRGKMFPLLSNKTDRINMPPNRLAVRCTSYKISMY